MIIDFKSGEEIEVVIDPDKAAEVAPLGVCGHYCPVVIDEASRTCTCKKCEKTIDAFTVVLKLFRHYESRIDSRVKAIKEFDDRERVKRERRLSKRLKSREDIVKKKSESLERACWNEYQAKLLTIRAVKQRAMADKLDKELNE